MRRSDLKGPLFDEISGILAGQVAADSIVWDRQKVGVRPLPAVELRITGPVGVGALNGDPVEQFNAGAPPGSEIVRGLAVDHEFSLRIQVRAVDADTAHDLAHAVDVGLFQLSTHGRLSDAGIVLVDSTPVLDVGELVETTWQGRAAFTVRIRVGDVEVDPERTTFIETAPVTGTAT